MSVVLFFAKGMSKHGRLLRRTKQAGAKLVFSDLQNNFIKQLSCRSASGAGLAEVKARASFRAAASVAFACSFQPANIVCVQTITGQMVYSFARLDASGWLRGPKNIFAKQLYCRSETCVPCMAGDVPFVPAHVAFAHPFQLANIVCGQDIATQMAYSNAGLDARRSGTARATTSIPAPQL